MTKQLEKALTVSVDGPTYNPSLTLVSRFDWCMWISRSVFWRLEKSVDISRIRTVQSCSKISFSARKQTRFLIKAANVERECCIGMFAFQLLFAHPWVPS
jgi:hypothetical protein